ncbi:sensor histidine kinase [Yoonia sp. R2331]|uniref:sensor histidine kinase n=1 Tax=Yoonia sp. R2331 TaxID=3237238 RepID=UPI0034E46E53
MAALLVAINQPWMGIKLAPIPEQSLVWVEKVDANGPAAEVSTATSLIAINGIELVPSDLIEEPDQFQTYEDYKAFMVKQQKLFEALNSGTVNLVLEGEAGTQALVPRTTRPVSSLPTVFWIQIVTGFASAFIGSWVWSLKRDEFSARLLFVAGFGILVMVFPAAIYSTRELAMNGSLFRWLSAVDHLGAQTFGVCTLMVFFVYPYRIAPLYAVWAIPLVIGSWWVADTAQIIFEGPPTGFHLPGLLMLAAFFAVATIQYRRAKDDPVAKAALACFALSVAIGAGMFVGVVIAPQVMGITPEISQGYAFVLFLLLFIGVAIGVARYRLFELGSWAFSILFYFSGVLLLLLIDAALVVFVSFERAPAFSVSLLLIALAYLPTRDYFARKLDWRWEVDREILFREVVDIALTSEAKVQETAWLGLLKNTFRPLNLQVDKTIEEHAPKITEEGKTLVFPALQTLPAIRADFAHSGRRLFSPKDQKLARELFAFLSHALERHHAYQKGATEERARISRDLHDNIGAQLLRALHNESTRNKDEILRETLGDLRDVINNISAYGHSAEDALADLRAETAERLNNVGIKLNWNLDRSLKLPLEPLQTYSLRSLIREAVSNVITHSRASQFSISFSLQGDQVVTEIEDDGIGFEQDAVKSGNGLTNMKSRISSLSGQFDILRMERGTRVLARFPIRLEGAAHG